MCPAEPSPSQLLPLLSSTADTAIMTDSTTPPPPPPRTEVEDAKENGVPEEEEEEDAPLPPAPSAAVTAAPPATVAAVAVAAPAQTGGGKRSPSDFLKTVLGRPVVVKLNSGIDYRGEHERDLSTHTCAPQAQERSEQDRSASAMEYPVLERLTALCRQEGWLVSCRPYIVWLHLFMVLSC